MSPDMVDTVSLCAPACVAVPAAGLVVAACVEGEFADRLADVGVDDATKATATDSETATSAAPRQRPAMTDATAQLPDPRLRWRDAALNASSPDRYHRPPEPAPHEHLHRKLDPPRGLRGSYSFSISSTTWSSALSGPDCTTESSHRRPPKKRPNQHSRASRGSIFTRRHGVHFQPSMTTRWSAWSRPMPMWCSRPAWRWVSLPSRSTRWCVAASGCRGPCRPDWQRGVPRTSGPGAPVAGAVWAAGVVVTDSRRWPADR